MQVRAKYMTLEPTKNRYVRYMRSIRVIQEYLIARAQRHAVPAVNNTQRGPLRSHHPCHHPRLPQAPGQSTPSPPAPVHSPNSCMGTDWHQRLWRQAGVRSRPGPCLRSR